MILDPMTSLWGRKIGENGNPDGLLKEFSYANSKKTLYDESLLMNSNFEY